jgi:PTH1 family peptidyl-tRNA hydrolase
MYEPTRHNVGFWLLDGLSRQYGISLRKPWFKNWESGSASLEGGHRLVLVKPLTYMNRSGDVLADNSDFAPADSRLLLVCCDQMDLPPGALRLKRQGGSAGHNGLKSVNAVIGAAFAPLYIGIGRPESGVDVVDHVLGPPSVSERQLIDRAIGRAVAGIDCLLTRGFEAAMGELNHKDETTGAASAGAAL